MPDYDKSEGGGIRGVAPSISQELPTLLVGINRPLRVLEINGFFGPSYHLMWADSAGTCGVGFAQIATEDPTQDQIVAAQIVAAWNGSLLRGGAGRSIRETARHDNPFEDQAS